MTVNEVIAQLDNLGVELCVDVAQIKLRGTGQQLNSALVQEISRLKAEIIREVALPVFIHLETRSACDISHGARKAAQHPTTEILSCVIVIDDRLIVWSPRSGPVNAAVIEAAASSKVNEFGAAAFRVQVIVGPEVPRVITDAASIGRTFCAHNAHRFHSIVWDTMHFPAPVKWADTLLLARQSGLPDSLDGIAQRIQAPQRHQEGVQCTNRACQHSFAQAPTGDELTTLIRHNVHDAILLRTVYPRLDQDREPEIIQVDSIINARGIRFDAALASHLIELDRRQRNTVARRLEEATAGTMTAADLDRVDFLLDRLRALGVSLPNLQRPTIEAVLSGWRAQQILLPDAAVAVLEARLATSRNSCRKLTKALELCCDDGRLRDQFIYHKNHTGRWAGQGVQLQNLPKPHSALDPWGLIDVVHEFDTLERRLPPNVNVGDAISSLIRLCFVPENGSVFCIADFASIEARGLAWCAGEQVLLDQFHSGRDVYCDLASGIFPYPVTREHSHERAIGKVAVLGCGYSMSGESFGDYAIKQGIDLAATGVTADQIVEEYRNAYPAIAGSPVFENGRTWRVGGLWQDVEQAARNALSNHADYTAGRCRFEFCDNSLRVTLPSGRNMYYRNARLEPDCIDWGTWRKPSIVFDLPDRANETTYGGKLVENIVQAICRDLLAAALVQCELQNLPVVLHVHDEIVIEVPERDSHECLSRLLQIMSTRPAWADGFPIEVEGFISRRYVKSQSVGGATMAYRNGSRLR